VLADHTIRRDVERGWEDRQRRAATGIRLPNAELAAALGAGAPGAEKIAASPDLLSEKRKLELAFYERFSGEDRQLLQDSDAREVAKRYRIEGKQAVTVRTVARDMAALSPVVERLVEVRVETAARPARGLVKRQRPSRKSHQAELSGEPQLIAMSALGEDQVQVYAAQGAMTD